MGIFSRVTARQRLRRATEESLTVPTFSAPLDCTPWVIGGLWPNELSSDNTEIATLADYLKSDLQRIADSANEDLRAIAQAGMAHPARRNAEARLISEARAVAARRVESTMRHLRHSGHHPRPLLWEIPGNGLSALSPKLSEASEMPPQGDMDKTQVIPVIDYESPAVDMNETQVIPVVRDDEPSPVSSGEPPPANQPGKTSEDVEQRLQRLLTFVVRQEPQLSWAVGERSDGTVVLVTDIAYGWIPPWIDLPDRVRLLEPAIRHGAAAVLLGDTVHNVTYVPGDVTSGRDEFTATRPSQEPRELPVVDDFGWELGVATHWRDGLPQLVNAMAKAAAAGTNVDEHEIDQLRLHLDAARYQNVAQYPEVDPAALLNCMLLAATEASLTSDHVSANYHFAWFKEVSAAQ